MGNQLIWNEQYNIGVDIIDKEHRKLFGILNKLFDFRRQDEKSQWGCHEAVKFFREHALQHFADEEAYMESVGYAGLETHRRIHKNFRERTLPALEKELERTKYTEDSINHFIGVCAGWLIGHTLVEDHAIVSGETVKQWENLLPEEEQAVMGQTIAGLLHAMFRLDAKLISACYGGEKFGDGVYCRLIYRTGGKKKCEYFLVFEEKLIAGMIGGVMDIPSEAVDVMRMHVEEYVAKRFVERVKEYFPFGEPFETEEEQWLTYEQFRRVFEKQSPQFSLLFDTGNGYFAYCMAASDLLPEGDGAMTLTQNAMAEAEKYLRREEEGKDAEGRKKKLLVVDDSDFILQMMHELLCGDYDVVTAKSGLSTIRGITLDRPDLILLDYEMPVCNGNQVLEMIRSEKEFADIPVIFLTNRVDRESVRKVLALKPEGYLSKSLPPESVKRKIDQFFQKKKESPKTVRPPFLTATLNS